LPKKEWAVVAKDLNANPEKAHTMMRAFIMSDGFTKLMKSKQKNWREAAHT
jgi:hypothetical protein